MIGLTWTGWDGSVWDLRTGPVRLSDEGLDGLLNSLEPDDVVRTGAELDGQSFVGWRAQPRTGLFPVLIGPFRTEGAFLANERAWWRTMRPGKVGKLTLTTYDGRTRRMGLRFQSDGLSKMPNFGTLRGRTYVAPIKVTADDPWWYGDQVGATYSAGDGFNFFGQGKKGPPFIIAKGNTVAKATFTNPGDDETWPVYTLWGPATKLLIKLGGGRVEYSVPLAVGERLVIDTSPLRKIAWRYAADGSKARITRDLDAFDFRPLPAGSNVDLELTVTGRGKFQIAADTRYTRAWG